ncbi:hypothetical protein HAV15_011674 [Penicillium sp. str. |nr:hypothetical protein HAV15_011674 [Penicillium sp. str. \
MIQRNSKPVLPGNIRTLNPEAKKAANDLFLSLSLWLNYEVEVQRAAPELLNTFRHRDTLPGQILGTVGSTYDDGELYLQSLLVGITEEHAWKQLVRLDGNDNPSVLCPLKYSEQDMAKFKTEYAKWEKDVERKMRVFEEIGVYTGWNGAVSPHDYNEVVRRLAVAKQNFLDRESANEEERAMWEKAWPFQDSVK